MTGLFYHDALRALCDAGARFVVVGGVAVNLQGVPRPTADLDIAIELSLDNVRSVASAFAAIGLSPRLPEPPDKLADPEVVRDWVERRNLKAYTFQDANNPLRNADVLVTSPVPYDELEREADVVKAMGMEIRIASISALLRMKAVAGRQQDLADIDALRRILEDEA